MTELQNKIIQKILKTSDEQLLDYLYEILTIRPNKEIYQLSELEKALINESQNEYQSGKTISNEDLIAKNEEWLKK